jgi:hypothetical protein
MGMSKPVTIADRRACLLIIPLPAAVHRLGAPAALAPEQCRSLLGSLARTADPRHRRGRRHALSAVLAGAVAAVLAGARSLAAVGEWASDAPARCWPPSGSAVIPDRCLARRACAACWPAPTATRWTVPSVPGWPASSHPTPGVAAGGRGRRQDPARQRPPPQSAGAPAGGDGPQHRCGPGPGRGGRQDQRDRPVPAAAGGAGPCRAGRHRRRRARPARPRRLAGHPKARRLPADREGQPAQPAPPAVLLPWREVPLADHTRHRGHGRVEVRRLQVTTVAGLGFLVPPRRSGSPDGSAPLAAAAGAP